MVKNISKLKIIPIVSIFTYSILCANVFLYVNKDKFYTFEKNYGSKKTCQPIKIPKIPKLSASADIINSSVKNYELFNYHKIPSVSYRLEEIYGCVFRALQTILNLEDQHSIYLAIKELGIRPIFKGGNSRIRGDDNAVSMRWDDQFSLSDRLGVVIDSNNRQELLTTGATHMEADRGRRSLIFSLSNGKTLVVPVGVIPTPPLNPVPSDVILQDISNKDFFTVLSHRRILDLSVSTAKPESRINKVIGGK